MLPLDDATLRDRALMLARGLPVTSAIVFAWLRGYREQGVSLADAEKLVDRGVSPRLFAFASSLPCVIGAPSPWGQRWTADGPGAGPLPAPTGQARPI